MQFKEPELQDSTIRKVLGLSTTSPAPSPQPHSGPAGTPKVQSSSVCTCTPPESRGPDAASVLFPTDQSPPKQEDFQGYVSY